jgi:hypothetical protein
MAYKLKYFGEFSDVQENDYRLEIYEKNYSFSPIRITLGAAPVVHTWDKDEPMPPIKGSQVRLNIVRDTNINLRGFFSNEDDTFQVKVFLNNALVFYGYVLQDECIEDLSDITNYITLTATDNLGLLKDISIDEAIGTTNFKYVSILDFIFYCLTKTNVSLPTVLFANLTETSFNTTQSFLSPSFLNFQSFTSSSSEQTYASCYDVLEKILGRFNASLFQSFGQWNVIRWSEQRYYSNAIPLRYFDETQVQVATGFYDKKLLVGDGTNFPIEFGATQSITRGAKFAKETFLYQRPANLIDNLDLRKLGSLIKSSTVGSGVNLQYIEEYNLVGWGNGFVWDGSGNILYNTATYKAIRVIKDYRFKEIDRYLIASGNGAPSDPQVISSALMEVNKGDILKISYDFKRKDSVTGPLTIPLFFWLNTKIPITPKGANNRTLNTDGTWKTSGGVNVNFTSSDDLGAQWNNFDIETKEIPFDGNFYIQLGSYNFGGYNEFQYKNFRIEVLNSSDKFGLVKGHTHKQPQNVNIKQTDDVNIYVDDSISNTIAGTLFGANTIGGLIRQRTNNWRRLHTSENRTLGDIMTHEIVF